MNISTHTLLKEDNILRIKTKECVLMEEVLCFASGGPAGHDVPRDDNGSVGLPVLFCSYSLQAGNTLSLVLEQRLV